MLNHSTALAWELKWLAVSKNFPPGLGCERSTKAFTEEFDRTDASPRKSLVLLLPETSPWTYIFNSGWRVGIPLLLKGDGRLHRRAKDSVSHFSKSSGSKSDLLLPEIKSPPNDFMFRLGAGLNPCRIGRFQRVRMAFDLED